MRRRTFLGILGGAIGLRAAGPLWAAPTPRGLILRSPTGQKVLDGTVREGVFMDTGTGKPESGMFGNVRRYADGSPRFHEGIDLAPVQPWRRNERPTDVVRAATDGLIVYVNSCDQNPSLYGNYVVMTHTVPSFGEVYTLYAHLRRFTKIRAGQRVAAGTALGILGHTPDIPLARAHLHFELGVLMNRYYPFVDPQHGIWNGANLYGIDPCDAFAAQRKHGAFDIATYLKARPETFALTLPEGTPLPDFFNRYPSLAKPIPREASMEIAFSYEGIPVACRPVRATTGEVSVRVISRAELKKGRAFVRVDSRAQATLTRRGEVLLDNLLVSPSHPPKHPVKQGEVG